MRKHRWIAAMMCIAVVATYVPAPVTAQENGDPPVAIDAPADPPGDVPAMEVGPGDGNEIAGWSWQKFWDYAACGAAIAVATSGAGVVAVAIACGRLISLYWTT